MMTAADANSSSPNGTRSPEGSRTRSPSSPGTLGMWLFLLSLAILFAASITAYLIVRVRAEVWQPVNMPDPPPWLWFSTAVILVSSGTIHWGLAGIRRSLHGRLIGAMLATTLLGLVFLVSQAINWAWLIAINATTSTAGLYIFTFYVLTGLHAVHVIGGLALLTVVTARSFAGRYSADHHPGVKYAVMYWHFLAAVWLVLFTLIFLVH